jgi:hypothetical protein
LVSTSILWRAERLPNTSVGQSEMGVHVRKQSTYEWGVLPLRRRVTVDWPNCRCQPQASDVVLAHSTVANGDWIGHSHSLPADRAVSTPRLPRGTAGLQHPALLQGRSWRRASGAVALGLQFWKNPSNIHVYIILCVVSSMVAPLVPLRMTVLTLR